MTLTKKQYFMLLWAVSAIAPIIRAIAILINDKSVPPTIPLMAVSTLIGGVFIYGLFLYLGMYFAQRIGLRFLLLDVNTDWYKDFLLPVAVIGTAYSCLLLVINAFTPLLVPFSVHHLFGWHVVFYKGFETVFNVINEDAIAILFVFSGLVLLIKKVAKNVSMSVVIPVAIICIAILPTLKGLFFRSEYILPSGIGVPFVFSIARFKMGIDIALLYTIAWLKGFETALLCHVFITIILSLIVPAVVIALGA